MPKKKTTKKTTKKVAKKNPYKGKFCMDDNGEVREIISGEPASVLSLDMEGNFQPHDSFVVKLKKKTSEETIEVYNIYNSLEELYKDLYEREKEKVESKNEIIKRKKEDESYWEKKYKVYRNKYYNLKDESEIRNFMKNVIIFVISIALMLSLAFDLFPTVVNTCKTNSSSFIRIIRL